MVVPNHMSQPVPGMYSGVARNADSSLYDPRSGEQPMYPVQHHLPSEHLPHHGKSYLAFVYNSTTGEFEQESSPDLAYFRNNLLDETSVELRKYVQNNRPLNASINVPPITQVDLAAGRHDQGHMYGDPMAIDDAVKRARSETISLGSIRREKPRPHKTRKVKSKIIIPDDDCVISTTTSMTTAEQHSFAREEMITFKVSETEQWEKWFCDAFRALQQLGCRTMAKEWIKIIHPKKQSTNPYNGKKLKQGTGNPESTKPSYWPRNVIHREPDHINKTDRTNLLLHLLMATPHKVMCPPGGVSQEKEVDAAALKAALEGKYEDKKYGLQGRRNLVDMIIHVRTNMEMFKDGGLPTDPELTVIDYANFRKPHSTDDVEATETETIDTTGDTLELTPQPDDYNDGDTMVITPPSDYDSPITTEMPVFSEAPQMIPKKLGVRKKAKRRSKQQDDNLQNVSFSGSTSTVGSHHMLSNSFGMDQMAQHPDQTPGYPPAMWNATVPPSSNPLASYQYPHFVPPDPRLAHIQTQYPTKQDFAPVPNPPPPFGHLPTYYMQQQPCYDMSYSGASHPQQFQQTNFEYFAQ